MQYFLDSEQTNKIISFESLALQILFNMYYMLTLTTRLPQLLHTVQIH